METVLKFKQAAHVTVHLLQRVITDLTCKARPYFPVYIQANSSVMFPESDLTLQASWSLPHKCVRSF